MCPPNIGAGIVRIRVSGGDCSINARDSKGILLVVVPTPILRPPHLRVLSVVQPPLVAVEGLGFRV